MKMKKNICDVKTINKVVSNIRQSNKDQQHTKKAADVKAQRYTSKAKKREEERALNIKEGVLAKFKQCADHVKQARAKANDLLVSYFRKVKNEELSFKLHSTEETAVLVKELNLQATVGDRRMIAATITITDCERIGADIGEEVMKLTISLRNPDTKKALNNRNPRRIDGLKDANIVIIEDEQGEIMAIILREIIPIGLTKQYNLFREFYEEVNTLYTRGCRAATYPDVDDIMRCLKSRESRDAGGFKKSNVKQIFDLQLTRTGKNVMIHYKNKKGDRIKWAFTSNLDRKAFKRGQFVDSPFNPLIHFLEVMFGNVGKYWLNRHGCNKVEKVMKGAMKELRVTGGMIGQHKHQLGIHTDPSSFLPTLVSGPTIYTYSNETNDWSQRVCDGGRLVMVDGCLYLEYLPGDTVFLNGNVLHTITPLTDKKGIAGSEQMKGSYSRFSTQLFSAYNRGANKHGQYGSYSCIW